MSNIKQYTISEWNDNKAVFAVDHSIMTEKEFHEINSFWGDDDYRLQEEDGNVVYAVLKMLAKFCFRHQTYDSLNQLGLVALFDYERGNGVEGWPKMDGSEGILIVSVDIPEFDIDEEVKVVALDKMPPAPVSSDW